MVSKIRPTAHWTIIKLEQISDTWFHAHLVPFWKLFFLNYCPFWEIPLCSNTETILKKCWRNVGWRNVEEMLVEEMLGSSIYDTILWVVVFTKLSNNWQIYNLKCWVIPGYLVPLHPWLATTPYGAELILLTSFIKLARIINYKLQIELTIFSTYTYLLGNWLSFIELCSSELKGASDYDTSTLYNHWLFSTSLCLIIPKKFFFTNVWNFQPILIFSALVSCSLK